MYNPNTNRDIDFFVLVRILDVQAVALYQKNTVSDDETKFGFFLPLTQTFEDDIAYPNFKNLNIMEKRGNKDFTDYLFTQLSTSFEEVKDSLPPTMINNANMNFDIETAHFLTEVCTLRKKFDPEVDVATQVAVDERSPKSENLEQIEITSPSTIVTTSTSSTHSESNHSKTPKATSPPTNPSKHSDTPIPSSMAPILTSSLSERTNPIVIKSPTSHSMTDHDSTPDSNPSFFEDLTQKAPSYSIEEALKNISPFNPALNEDDLTDYSKIEAYPWTDADEDLPKNEVWEKFRTKPSIEPMIIGSTRENAFKFSKMMMFKRLKAQKAVHKDTEKNYLLSIQPFLIEPIRRNVALLVIVMLHTMASNYRIQSNAFRHVIAPSPISPTFNLNVNFDNYGVLDDLYNDYQEEASVITVVTQHDLSPPLKNSQPSTQTDLMTIRSTESENDFDDIEKITIVPELSDVFSNNFMTRINDDEYVNIKKLQLKKKIIAPLDLDNGILRARMDSDLTNHEERNFFEIAFSREKLNTKTEDLFHAMYLLKMMKIEFQTNPNEYYFNNYFFYGFDIAIFAPGEQEAIEGSRLYPGLVTPIPAYYEHLDGELKYIDQEDVTCPPDYGKGRLLRRLLKQKLVI